MWMNLYLSQTTKCIPRKGALIPFFSPLQLYIKAALDGGADSPPLARQRRKHWKSHQPNCLSQSQNIFPSHKKKKRRYLPSKEDIHVHLLRLCKQAWKSGCTGMASPCGFDLQGPVQDPVIGCWRCCWVELRTANSHVSSGQPPPEHWALHRTASVGTRSRASRHRILNVALEAF